MSPDKRVQLSEKDQATDLEKISQNKENTKLRYESNAHFRGRGGAQFLEHCFCDGKFITRVNLWLICIGYKRQLFAFMRKGTLLRSGKAASEQDLLNSYERLSLDGNA